jgi:hypothetical protein
MLRLARTGVLVAIAAFAPASFAENLIVNPDFSQWLGHWGFASNGWIGNIDADLADGSPAPPSARLYGSDGHPNSSILSACAQIDAAYADLSFDIRVAAGTATGSVIVYADDACSIRTDLPIVTDTIEASVDWRTVSVGNLALPAGTRSVQFALYAQHSGTNAFADLHVDHIALGPAGTLSATIPIDQFGLTGAWYDPAESGQGFQFTVDPVGGTLFGAWYTWDNEAGGPDTQRWYSLEASLASDGVSADVTIFQNIGGTFAGPPATIAKRVGIGTLAFDSCTSGTFEYAMDDGREGSIRMRTLFPQSECDEGGHPSFTPGPPGLSGAWYDPSHGGQGAMISIDPYVENVFVGWYTYAADVASAAADGQRWFSAQGLYDIEAGPVVLALYESIGGVFDASDPVSTVPVGTATLDFASCESATLDYAFYGGELAGKSGTLPLTRLGTTPQTCALSYPNP